MPILNLSIDDPGVYRMCSRALTGRIALLLLSWMLCSGVAAAELSVLDKAQVTEIWDPVPTLVRPGVDGRAPSDALILFGGTDSSQWESVNGGPVSWRVADGAITVVAGSGDIRTRQAFEDVQLHLEWRAPVEVVGESQGRGNSGVFLMDRYEIQVLDSYDNETYANGQAGSIYKQHIPLVNASRGSGEWQVFDSLFTAPRFAESGRVVEPARVTLLHNGVLVQYGAVIQGPTVFVGAPIYQPHGAAPIRLQDHRNPVSFRNIWVRRL